MEVQKKAAQKLRKVFRESMQWGDEMPGGCEALVHWRGLMGEEAMAGRMPPVVVVTFDCLEYHW